MKAVTNFGDSRQMGFCAHCGGSTETRDHVPSRIFLDKPYPSNLPVVPCCTPCNNGFSLDEEYVACLIDCVLAGSCEPGRLGHGKTRSILSRKPALARRIEQGRKVGEGETIFSFEEERVANVVLKLARCHAAYELNEPQLEKPRSLSFGPLPLLSDEEMNEFETLPDATLWPEVGSRAMQRIVEGVDLDLEGWMTVQSGRYRYATQIADGVVIRIVLSEYLGCQVVWEL